MRFVFFLGSAVLLLGCSGDVFVDGDAGSDASPDVIGDAPTSDAQPPPPADGGSFTCGSTTCEGAAICVHPCCGGANVCEPADDGGTCPNGTTKSSTCPPEAPCTYVCTPPPPYCGTTKDCSPATGHDCYLLCA